MKRKYDHYNRPEPAIIYLAKPGRHLLCALNSVEWSNVSVTKKTNNTHELTFDVHKSIDGEPGNGYDDIDVMMELFCDGMWFKIAEAPGIDSDGTDEVKHVTAESYEIGLLQYDLVGFEVNTGSAKSYEMAYREAHNNDKYYQVKFCDKDNTDLSLLHLMLKHANVPGWTIGYIDDITPNANDPTLYLKDEVYLFNVETQSVYVTLTQDVASAFSCVFEFDTVNLKINAYRVESLGKDTNIFLGFRNLQNSITRNSNEDIYTVFNVSGNDDLSIEAANFGENTIEDISYFMTERYMPQALINKYKSFVEYRESQRPEYINLSKQYNDMLNQLSELKDRVPVDGASNDWQHMDVDDLKTAYNDYTAIITGLESLYVDEDGNFNLEALKASSDWELYESTMNYVLPQIIAALQGKEDSDTITDYGSGNILKNPNPIIMDKFWRVLESTAHNSCVDIIDAPIWGITRGLQSKLTASSSSYGFEQKNISVIEGNTYVLSVYIKSTSTSFNLEYGAISENRTVKNYTITPNVWTRIYHSFTANSQIIQVGFSASGVANDEFTICGMQLEMGTQPTSFGYYSQSEDVLLAFETDWKLFGIDELKAKLNSYKGAIKTLKDNGYDKSNNDMIGVEEDYQNQLYQKYLDYQKLAEECQAALKERQGEYNKIKTEQDLIQEQRQTIAANVRKENFGKIQEKYEGFTEDELLILQSLYKQTDYANDNIVTTTLDGLADIVDIQKKLYDDAIEQLYAESHPQYSYTNSVDNLYALPEFKDFHGDLDINNFLRVAIRDDYCVKLRATEITYNPCSWDNEISITFSNMTQYKSKRNDFISLIDNAIKSTKRQVVGGANEQITTYAITPEVISQILRSSIFKNYIGNWTGGIPGAGSGSITAGSVTADSVITALLKADEAQIGKLTADTAFITYLSSTLITSEKIIAGILEADEATIKNLSATIINASELNADVANIKSLLAGNAGIGDLVAINLTADNVTISDAVIKDLIAAKISVGDLMAYSATTQELTLISQDGKPSITFKGSTQQFYDSNGNIRVQIGQDGNGNFNFIVRGTDGATVLLDSTGIKRDGIPDGTIINNMIESGTISKDRLGFQIVETDENGNVDIGHIVIDGEKFGAQYTQYITQTKEEIDSLKGQVTNIQLIGERAFIDDNGRITPDKIFLRAVTKNNAVIGKWYIDDVENTEFVSADKTTFTIPANYMADKKIITVKVESADKKVYDLMDIHRLENGSATITPIISSSKGSDFVDGTVIENTTLSCTVYRGAEIVEPNSYIWYQKMDDADTWVQIGTQATVSILLADFTDICGVKCAVDV